MRNYHSVVLWCIGQVLCLFSPITAFAQTARLHTQEVEKRGNYFSYQTARISERQPYRVQPGFTFTSIVLQIDPAYDYEGAYIISETDTFLLRTDEHAPRELEKKQSALIIFDEPVREFLLHPGHISGEIVFNFMHAGQLTVKNKNLRAEQETHDACAAPAAVSQEEWRKGLPAPTYVREFHEVEHLIIHHAATLNELTDYTEVVRNIYLWHTQTNGWSDIGYNYLIAQDGTIYQGRDPGSGEQDKVKGAHFCGENTGTMGICLLGTYTDVAPTDTTVASLLQLIAWKVNKDQLNPLAFKPHPANPVLGVIAGHRDGCATICPGDGVYAKMQEFREFTDLFVAAACEDPVLDTDDELAANQVNVFPVPAEDEVHVVLDHPQRLQAIKMFDMNGREVSILPAWQGNQLSFSIAHLPAGIYVLKLLLPAKVFTRKIVIKGP